MCCRTIVDHHHAIVAGSICLDVILAGFIKLKLDKNLLDIGDNMSESREPGSDIERKKRHNKPFKKQQGGNRGRLEDWPFWMAPRFDEMGRMFDNLRRDLENYFPNTTGTPFQDTALFANNMPARCDLIDEGDKFVIEADMPGIRKNEIQVNVSDDTAQITAEHKERDEEKKRNYIRKERSEMSFNRVMELPERVKGAEAKAKLQEGGVLRVEIPKENPRPKPQSTQITVE